MQSRVRHRFKEGNKNRVLEKQRSSNIELLRILAMIGIIISHLVLSSPHGPAIIAAGNHHTLFLVLIQALGQIGVFVFFLITGYFLVNKTDFSLGGIKKILVITWFYSALFFAGALLIGALGASSYFGLPPSGTALSSLNILKNLLPILQNNYWFVNAYILILFLAPALNKLIGSVSRRRLGFILLGVTLGFYILNYYSRLHELGLTFEIYNNLLLYSLVYAVGAYLRLHPPRITTRGLYALLGIGLILYFMWRCYLVYVLHTADIANRDVDFPPFMIAIITFTLFLRLKVAYRAWINIVGANVFAVYIIHTNMNIWPFLWKTFDVYSVFGSKLVYIYPFVVATFVFACCIAIEIGRQKLFMFAGRLYARKKVAS